MQAGLKTCNYFKDHFYQAYTSYQIRKKAKAANHGYGDSANHALETESQAMTVDALQALACVAMEDKEEM